MRYIAYIDWIIYRKDILARLPYYCVPFIALAWFLWKRYDRVGLFFTAGLSLINIFNHGYAVFISMRFGLPFFRLTGREAPVRMNVMAALLLAVFFSILSLYIFRCAKRLYTLKNEESQASSDIRFFFALLLLLFCHISPYVNYKGLARQSTNLSQEDFRKTVIQPVTVLHAGSNIQYMAGSPDGNLLAIGTSKGLYIWDVELQQRIWCDESLKKVCRIRFSPSGKYLAAGGRGVPEGASDVVVYEVEGFKRVPNVELAEEDLSKEKIFHDIAFRPDEKSVLVAWHRDWDWEQIPGGYHGEEAKSVRWSESAISSPKYPSGMPKKDLVCTELSLEKQGENYFKTIKTLSTQYDLLPSGGIGFSHSASMLLYPGYYTSNAGLVARHRLYLVDTQTWSEEEIMLEKKYSMHVGVGVVSRYSDWHEWKFTQDEKDVFILAEERDVNGMGRGMNTRAYLLLKLCLSTKQTQEIVKIPATPEIRNSAWTRIALSEDEKRLALLGLSEPLENYGESYGKFVILRIVDLATKESGQIAYSHGRRAYGRQIVWLSEENVAVSFSETTDEFFLNKIEEGK